MIDIKDIRNHASSFALSWYGPDGLRYGGSGLPFITNAECNESVDATFCEVTLADFAKRASVLNHVY